MKKIVRIQNSFNLFCLICLYLLYVKCEGVNGVVSNISKSSFRDLKETVSAKNEGVFPKLFGYIRDAFIPKSSRKEAKDDTSLSFDKHSNENDFEGVDEAYFSGDEFVNDIAKGVEESLWISHKDRLNASEVESKREIPVYLFQGQYLAEPRLNRFIDGAMENLVREMKDSTLDPIYFRVLPKGRVIGRPKPLLRGGVIPVKAGIVKQQRIRRIPVRRLRRQRRRRRPLLGRALFSEDVENVETGRQRRRKQVVNQRNKKRRKVLNQGVGGGRVNGISKVVRDGDAEMQLFGNYTLIRSHYNMGPIQLIMQFRTIRGLRRAGATLDRVKIHTVTRVNTQGCEMIDFLLDRPHAETIQIQDQLFPLANRVAQNIFSRLFEENSFLVARIREKTGLALLSKKSSY